MQSDKVNVSEEHVVSIFRVLLALRIKTDGSSETLITGYRT